MGKLALAIVLVGLARVVWVALRCRPPAAKRRPMPDLPEHRSTVNLTPRGVERRL